MKLVWDWKQAWKWASIQFIAISASLQLALLAFPQDIRAYLPDWLTHALAITLLAAAALGRITAQGPPDANLPK